MQEDSDVSRGDADAVQERLDVCRNLLRKQRQRIGQIDAAAEDVAEVDGEDGTVVTRRGDCLARAYAAERHFLPHHSAYEVHQLGQIDVHAGLTEVAEVDVKTRVFAHEFAVLVGIEEGRVVRISAVHRFVITIYFGYEDVIAVDIAVIAECGREVVRISLLSFVLVRVVFHSVRIAEGEIDAEHRMVGCSVVGRRAEHHGRIDEVEEIFEAEEVVDIVVRVIDAAVRIGHRLRADKAHHKLYKRDEVKLFGQFRQSGEYAVFVKRTEFVKRVETAQIVDERTELEFQRNGEFQSAQDFVLLVAFAYGCDDGIEVVSAVREEILEQACEVYLAAHVEEQVERDGLAERHRIDAVEVVVFFQFVRRQRILSLFGEVHIDVIYTDVKIEFRIISVGICLRAFHITEYCLTAAEVDRASRITGRLFIGFRISRQISPCSGVVNILTVRGFLIFVECPAAFFRIMNRFIAHIFDRFGVLFCRRTESSVFFHKQSCRIGLMRVVRSLKRIIPVFRRFDCRFRILVSVARKHKCDIERDIDSVAEVYRHIQTAEQVFVNEASERVAADCDVFEQITHKRVADGERESAFADKQRSNLVFRRQTVVHLFVRIRVVSRYRFGRRAARNFHIVVNGSVEQVAEHIFDEVGDFRHRHGELGHIEEGKVDIQHTVEIVCRKPFHFRPRFGGQVVQFDRYFGTGQVLHIQHNGEVQTQMCGGITLVGFGDFDDDAVEVAEYARENLTHVNLPFRDGKFELNGHPDRDDGIVERHQRHIVIVLSPLLRLDLGVNAGIFVISISLALPVIFRGGFGLARGDVIGHERIGAAEFYLNAAEFKPDVHRADVRTERKIEVGYRRVRRVDAVEFSLRIAHIAELPDISLQFGGFAFNFIFKLIMVRTFTHIQIVFCGTVDVGHKDIIVAVANPAVERGSAHIEIAVFADYLNKRTDVGFCIVDRFVMAVPVSRDRGGKRTVRFFHVISAAKFALGFDEGQGVSLHTDVVCRGGTETCYAVFFRDSHIFAVFCRRRLIEHVVNAFVIVSAYLRAQRHVEVVEDVGNAAEVGYERGKHRADNALGEHNLHCGVGIDEFEKRVTCRSAALGCRDRRGKRLRRRAAALARRNVRRRAELCGFDDELQEVGYIGIVLDHVEDVGAVKIQFAV